MNRPFRRQLFPILCCQLTIAAALLSTFSATAGDRILLSDQGNPPFDGIFLLEDSDGNGSVDSSESTVWFDRTNAEGLLGPESNFLNVLIRADESVIAFDGDSNAVFRMRDNNGDDDALDLGESNIFLDSNNSIGFEFASVNGLAEDDNGFVYLVHARTNVGIDAILRAKDLNNDGDANDAGELIIWADLEAFDGGSSTAFEIAFDSSGNAYYVDLLAGNPDTLFKLSDVNNDGVIESAERTVFLVDGDFGVGLGFSIDIDGTDIFVVDNSGDEKALWKLTDIDNSGTINASNEVTRPWGEDTNADGITTGTTFDFASGKTGADFYILSSASDDAIIALTDGNNDGDFDDAGETTIFADGLTNDFDRPRSIAVFDSATGSVTLSDFSVNFGSLQSGNLDDLLESDDSRVVIRSQFGFLSSEPNVSEILIGAIASDLTATMFNIQIESRNNNPDGHSTVKVRNFANGTLENVGTFSTETTDTTVELTNIDTTDRLRMTDGRVEIAVRTSVIATFSLSGFLVSFDQVALSTQ